MSTGSKQITDRFIISRAVRNGIDKRGNEVADAITPILFPDGEPVPNIVRLVIHALGDCLTRSDAELRKADLAHAAELADDPEVRQKRDAALKELRTRVKRVKGGIISDYGEEALEHVGLDGETPLRGDPLLRYAENAIQLLEAGKLGEPLDDDDDDDEAPAAISAQQLAKRLRRGTTGMRTAIEHVSREKVELQQTFEARDETIDRWHRFYHGVADIFVSFCSMGSFRTLAKRFKPTARRRSGRPEPSDIEDSQAADPNASASERP